MGGLVIVSGLMSLRGEDDATLPTNMHIQIGTYKDIASKSYGYSVWFLSLILVFDSFGYSSLP